jgi:hypothetical protein
MSPQAQDEADWEEVRTRERLATNDVHVRGIGSRRLQLIVFPSFAESRAWEVRQLQKDWKLYRSRVIGDWPSVKLRGYDPLPIDPVVLSSFFSRVVSLSLPIAPDLSGWGGLDGTVTQLAVFGDVCSEWRFQWWSQPPSNWAPLTAIATEMEETFAAAEECQSPPS